MTGQLDIFDAVPPRFPRAHTRDPISSQRAAADGERTGRFKRNAAKVFEALKARPGSTSAELARYCGMDVHELRRRLTDLALPECNLAKRVDPYDGMPVCAVSGKKACRWEPV